MDLHVLTRLLISELYLSEHIISLSVERVWLLQTLLHAGTKEYHIFLLQFEREIIVVSQIPL